MQSELSFSTRDEFSRKPIAEKLINLLGSDIDLSPVVINGDWGTGKTEFCLKTIQEMKVSNEKLKCVYIDAFNADSSDEPILTLIAAIVSLFPDKEVKKSIINKAIPVIKFASKVFLNTSTTLILKENAEKLGEEFSNAIKEQAATAIDVNIDNLLDTHEKSTENINALRSILESLAIDSPVIVFIDELDRCRPNYALKMIESIKHTFNIKNVRFVLVANLNQLSSSINKLYGESINANKYLDKFIGLKVDLPDFHKQDNNIFYQNSIKYFYSLVNESEDLDFFLHEENNALIKSLIMTYNLSLRDVDKIVKYFLIYQNVGDKIVKNELVYLKTIYKIIGVFIYSLDLELKNKFLNDNYTCEDILNFFNFEISMSENLMKNELYYNIEKIIISILFGARDFYEFKGKYPNEYKMLMNSWTIGKETAMDCSTNGDFSAGNAQDIINNTMHELMLL